MIRAWRDRGLDLWHAMPALHPTVSLDAMAKLLETVLSPDNPACYDEANAAHVMAQNDNVVVLSQWVGVDPEALAVALAAGMVHDLNKYPGARLRSDRYTVRLACGTPVVSVESEAEVIGLNHYGERTRAVLSHLVQSRCLSPSVAHEIDEVVVHHGLGSSQFVRDLVKGHLAFHGHRFVREDGLASLRLPPQPKLRLASVVHDLADSTQQMQAGVAWVSKYPLKYWHGRGHTWLDHLSIELEEGQAPLSLLTQLRVEHANCQRILQEAVQERVLTEAIALRFERAVEALVSSGRDWADHREEVLHLPKGATVFHSVGQSVGTSPSKAKILLASTCPGVDAHLDRAVLRASQQLDEGRAKALASALRA